MNAEREAPKWARDFIRAPIDPIRTTLGAYVKPCVVGGEGRARNLGSIMTDEPQERGDLIHATVTGENTKLKVAAILSHENIA